MQNFFFFLMAIIANMATIALASPLATRGDAPPPEGGGLTWCTTQDEKTCTVGIHNNFDTHEIDAYIFDKDCNVYASSDAVLTDSLYNINWKDGSGKQHTGSIYVHDVTGGSDEFWFDGGDHYADGWTYENPLPVYYEYRAFRCE
ncbi:hypothetical protein LA080_014730 [Diaporthe eres]|uniref:Uncharacterized protein n=1 Tax=Diaporthe vaccinii TaxID=105482 RepID=A0ABR4FEB6_9PEZI|nr:hypothetical protein LA080_014730 [Diaporthe eres]